MSTVFVGVVTYVKEKGHLDLWLQHLAAQTHTDWSLHIIDTTKATAPNEGPYLSYLSDRVTRALPRKRVSITEYEPRDGETVWEAIGNAKDQLRRDCIDSGADYLFFLDSDVILPPSAIARLLSHRAPVAAGLYLTQLLVRTKDNPDGKVEVIPLAMVRDPGLPLDCVRPLHLHKALEPQVFPIVATGLGCALLSRKVLHIPTIVKREVARTEDIPFYLEVERQGFTVLFDTSVQCNHVKYPLGDRRNLLLTPSYWKRR